MKLTTIKHLAILFFIVTIATYNIHEKITYIISQISALLCLLFIVFWTYLTRQKYPVTQTFIMLFAAVSFIALLIKFLGL